MNDLGSLPHRDEALSAFNQLKDGDDNTVSGGACVPYFTKINADRAKLRLFWDESDRDSKGRLNESEFIVMYHLTKLNPEETNIDRVAARLFRDLKSSRSRMRNIDVGPSRRVHNRRSRNQRIEPDSPTSPKDEDQPNRMV